MTIHSWVDPNDSNPRNTAADGPDDLRRKAAEHRDTATWCDGLAERRLKLAERLEDEARQLEEKS